MGDIGKGIGEFIEFLLNFAALSLGLIISLVILLVLSLTGIWSPWFFLIIPVICSIFGYLGRRLTRTL